jgi:hypothetical protein
MTRIAKNLVLKIMGSGGRIRDFFLKRRSESAGHGGYRLIFKLLVGALLVLLFTFSMGIISVSDIETSDAAANLVPGDPDAVLPEQAVKTDMGLGYGISQEHGFLVSADSGKTWAPRNEGLPTKLVYPFTQPKVRTLSAFGVDPLNPQRVAVTTASFLFISENSGMVWERIPFKSSNQSLYLTAVALSPHDPNTLAVGTSFAGIYETRDRGKTWRNITENLKFLYQGAGFWEEMSALTYLPQEPDTILFSCGFGNGLYLFHKDRKGVTPVDITALSQNTPVGSIPGDNAETAAINTIDFNRVFNQLFFAKGNAVNAIEGDQAWLLEIGTGNGIRLGTLNSNQITPVAGSLDLQLRTFQPDQVKLDRLRRASNKYGIYLRSDSVQGKKFDAHLKFLKKYGFNSLVVDFKDDSGYITYDTKLPMPREVGAVRANIKMEQFMQKVKENGIYVIARVVVFQDPRLHRFQKYKYAVWNRVTNGPWSTKEYWVDPFCSEVWDYDLAIAEELQSLGIDEIQFDYIRFPTDGDIGNATYRYRPAGAEKIDALESFLAKARERLTIPISTDLYGFNCWSRVDSVNGQNLGMITRYVDTVCPMYYPSHFTRSFMAKVEYLERARRIYGDGSKRAYIIAGKRALIRPYVQAFLLGGETRMGSAGYQKYLQNQIEGVLSGPSPGYTLWNYGNTYFMVTKPIREYGKVEKTGVEEGKQD